jgi:hypothetical protein
MRLCIALRCLAADVAELADAPDSKSWRGNWTPLEVLGLQLITMFRMLNKKDCFGPFWPPFPRRGIQKGIQRRHRIQSAVRLPNPLTPPTAGIPQAHYADAGTTGETRLPLGTAPHPCRPIPVAGGGFRRKPKLVVETLSLPSAGEGEIPLIPIAPPPHSA